MKEEFRPAIEALQNDLRELERKAAETKTMINRLCEIADAPPMYTDIKVSDSRPTASYRADQFYGKVLTTAAREFLEMRHTQNRGPATPREIYDALSQGGFKFDTKIEVNAITNIRATLRKNSSIFHRLPNGLYGLLAWYPNARAIRQEDGADDGGAVAFTPKRPLKRAVRPLPHPQQKSDKVGIKRPVKGSISPFTLKVMADGTDWTTERLRQEAVVQSVPGIHSTTSKGVFHGALLSLKNQGLVTQVGDGKWRIVPISETATADTTKASAA